MMVCEGCAAVGTCSGCELQIVNLPVLKLGLRNGRFGCVFIDVR